VKKDTKMTARSPNWMEAHIRVSKNMQPPGFTAQLTLGDERSIALGYCNSDQKTCSDAPQAIQPMDLFGAICTYFFGKRFCRIIGFGNPEY
jgi:hypothetical protein